jgi:hypothetical protein
MKKPDLSIPTINGNKLTWSGNVGTIEASEAASHERIWNDSMDLGFWVYSPKSDTTKLFVLSYVKVDDEGEILHWDHVSYPDPDFTVRVFND